MFYLSLHKNLEMQEEKVTNLGYLEIPKPKYYLTKLYYLKFIKISQD